MLGFLCLSRSAKQSKKGSFQTSNFWKGLSGPTTGPGKSVVCCVFLVSWKHTWPVHVVQPARLGSQPYAVLLASIMVRRADSMAHGRSRGGI